MSKKLILKKIMNHLNIHKDYLFADFLGIGQSTLSNWYKRDIIDYELIISKCDFLDANWLLTGEGEMLKNSAQDSAIVNESETPYTNTSDKLDEARERIITLQEKLIEARDRFLEADKEVSDLKNDFIAAQKKVLELTDQNLELTNQNHSLEKKYNSLKESILSKNIYNMLSDSEFFEKAKMNFNHVPMDLALMFIGGSLFL